MEADIVLNQSGATCSTKTVTTVDANTRDVAISGCTGDGTVGITILAGTASDALGNEAPASSPSSTFNVDNTAPTVTVSTPDQTDVNQSGTVNYTVTYAGHSATTLADTDVTLNQTGVTCTGKVVTNVDANTYNVAVSTCSGDGTVGITIEAGTATDIAGNSAAASSASDTFNVDNTPPTISISATPTADPIKDGSSSSFTVTYAGHTTITLADANVNLNTTGDATCGNKVVSGSGNTRTITFSNCTGDGTVGFDLAAGTAADALGNQALASADSNTFTVDNTAPTFTVSAPTPTDVNSSGTANFTVTYADYNTITLSNTDITLNQTGAACSTVVVSGSGDSRNVAVSGCLGDGTVGITVNANSATDVAGNQAAESSPSSTFNVSNAPPTIAVTGPDDNDVNSTGTSTFTVTYGNYDTISLSEGDITLNQTGAACTTKTITGTGDTRSVAISGCLGDGTVGITIIAGTAVDALGNEAPASSPSSTFNVDNTAPTVTVSTPDQTDVNQSGTVNYTVTYAGHSATTLADTDVTLNETGVTCTGKVVTNVDANTYNVAVSTCSGDGTVGITIEAGTATDIAGNSAAASSASDTFNVDNTPPTVSISAVPTNGTVTQAGSSSFTVTYAGHTTITLEDANVNLNTTGDATCGNKVVTGSGNTRTITFSNCTGDGTVGFDLAAGTAADALGNQALASADSNTFTVDNAAPTLTVTGPTPASISSAGTASYTVTYADYNTITLSDTDITLNQTGATCTTKTVSGSGDSRTVSVSGCTGDGTVSISIAGNTATDLAGNQTSAEGPSSTFTVDNTDPTISVSAPDDNDVNSTGVSTYTVTYAGHDSISLVEADIVLNQSGATCSTKTVTTVDANTRDVAISGCTGDGTVGITILAGTASDALGNEAPASSPSSTFNVDNTAPTVTVSTPDQTDVNQSGTVNYTVTYAGHSATTLADTDVTLNQTGVTCTGKVVTNVDANTYNVAVSTCSGDGTVGITVDSGTATDIAGNSAAASSASDTFNVDNTPPTISISATPTADPIKDGSSSSFTVTYAGHTTITLADANVNLNTTDDATCGNKVVSGGGNTRTITFSNCTGDGTVGFDLAAGTAADALGNQALASADSNTFTVDNTAPTFTVSAPTPTDVNSSGTANFTVTYADYNTITLSNTDITLNQTGAACSTVVVSGSGNSRNVAVSGCLGDGTVGITVNANSATDVAGNQAAESSPSSTFNVSNAPPTIAVTGPDDNDVNSTGTSTFTVTYGNYDTISLSEGDITLNQTGAACTTKTITGTGDTRSVAISGCLGDGTVGITIIAGTAVDALGNEAPASSPSSTFNVDNTAPTVTVSTPDQTDVNQSGTVNYTVTYAGHSATTLADTDVTLNQTGVTCTGKVVTNVDANTYNVAVSTCSGDGTVGITIEAGTATDIAGNSAAASSASDTFNVDNTPPTVSISAVPTNGTVTQAGSSSFTVTYAGHTTITLEDANVNLNTTGDATCGNKVVTGSGNTRTITFSNCTGDGTVGFDLAAGTAADALGNQALASADSNTFTVDNAAPTLTVTGPTPASISSAGTASYTVTYADYNTITLSDTDITLNQTGATCTTKTVSGSGDSRTVSVSGCTGDGTVGINILAGTATDLAGNQTSAEGPSSTFTVDNTDPTISVSAPDDNDVNSTGVSTYTVTYAGHDSISLVEADIVLNQSGATCSTKTVTTVDANTRDVAISGCTGDGTVGITILAGTASDALGNEAPASSPSSTFNVDNTAPTVTVSTPDQTDVNQSGTVNYTVTYAGHSATTLADTDVTLNQTGVTCTGKVVTNVDANTYNVAVSTCSGDGTVGITIEAGTATDIAGNSAAASSASDTFNVDNTAPNLTLSTVPTNGTVSSDDSSSFTVTYAGHTTITLADANVNLNTTGDATCGNKVVSGAGNTRTITFSNCTGNGTVGFDLAAGTAVDEVGNLAPVSANSNTFTVDNTAPTFTVSAPTPTDVNSSGTANFTVTYADYNTITLSNTDITLNQTGAACSTVVVSGSGDSRNVAVSGCLGDGTVGITILANTATDLGGNNAPESSPSSTFAVDNTAPTFTLSGPDDSDVNSSGTSNYTITYSNYTSISLSENDVILNQSGAACTTKAISGTGDARTITISGCLGDGTVGITVSSGTATDTLGNLANESSPSSSFNVDNTAPTINISAPSLSGINSSGTNNYTITYTGYNTINLTDTDIAFNFSGATCSTKTVSGSGDSRTVAVSGCTGDGTVGITVNSGTALDIAGNTAPESSPSTTFIVDNTAPTLVLTGPDNTDINSSASSSYTATYSNYSAITLSGE